jgi:hypothetical protein
MGGFYFDLLRSRMILSYSAQKHFVKNGAFGGYPLLLKMTGK